MCKRFITNDFKVRTTACLLSGNNSQCAHNVPLSVVHMFVEHLYDSNSFEKCRAVFEHMFDLADFSRILNGESGPRDTFISIHF